MDRPIATLRPSTKLAIESDGLTKRYGEILAVDRLSIQVPRGGVTGFVGPNGAGKTTTIRMLLGLIRPSAGTAKVLGRPTTSPASYLPRVGALIEAPAFYPPLSGRRNLEILAALGGHDATRIPAVLALVGLTERAKSLYKTYSLGMKQRLGIAAALLPDPELLILDEP
ncbi:MAG TPA: ATP-binding cassette domain-containing protein, partial [Candidatus Thermoplasmatota archaeon]